MGYKKLPNILDNEEGLKLIMQPSERYPTGVRNKAILSLMLNSGMRLSEIANLRIGDIDLNKGVLRIINGKGGKDRNLAIPEYAIKILKKWNELIPERKYFFTTLKGTQIRRRYIQAMVKRYGRRAGLNKNISPHTLRHSYATEFYRKTKDIETLRLILGHSNISTTMIYITLANTEVEDAMRMFTGFK